MISSGKILKDSVYSYVTVRHCKCCFRCSLVSKFYSNKHIVDCNFPAYKFLVRTRCISSDLNCFASLGFVLIGSTAFYGYMVGCGKSFKNSIHSYIASRHFEGSSRCTGIAKLHSGEAVTIYNFPTNKLHTVGSSLCSDGNGFASLCFVLISSTAFYCYMIGSRKIFKHSIYSYVTFRHFESCFFCSCISKVYSNKHIVDCYLPAYKLLTIRCVVSSDGNRIAFFCFIFVFSCTFFICSTAYYCYVEYGKLVIISIHSHVLCRHYKGSSCSTCICKFYSIFCCPTYKLITIRCIICGDSNSLAGCIPGLICITADYLYAVGWSKHRHTAVTAVSVSISIMESPTISIMNIVSRTILGFTIVPMLAFIIGPCSIPIVSMFKTALTLSIYECMFFIVSFFCGMLAGCCTPVIACVSAPVFRISVLMTTRSSGRLSKIDMDHTQYITIRTLI